MLVATPDTLGGTIRFKGTRIPGKILFDYVLSGKLKIILGGNELYLQAGDSISLTRTGRAVANKIAAELAS